MFKEGGLSPPKSLILLRRGLSPLSPPSTTPLFVSFLVGFLFSTSSCRLSRYLHCNILLPYLPARNWRKYPLWRGRTLLCCLNLQFDSSIRGQNHTKLLIWGIAPLPRKGTCLLDCRQTQNLTYLCWLPHYFHEDYET